MAKEFGEIKTHNAIKYLDEYIEEKGYKSRSHYMALRRWVFDAVKEHENKKTKSEPSGVDGWVNAVQNAEARFGGLK